MYITFPPASLELILYLKSDITASHHYHVPVVDNTKIRSMSF